MIVGAKLDLSGLDSAGQGECTGPLEVLDGEIFSSLSTRAGTKGEIPCVFLNADSVN
jgi:hypothetical protein